MNEELAELVEKGREAWNRWREANPTASIDLSYADFAGRNFVGYDLRNANLSYSALADCPFASDLRGADFSHADLSRAGFHDFSYMQGIKLHSADLTGAHLDNRDLRGVDLSRAKLNGASLVRADLSFARLEEAQLTRANLFRATAVNARCSRAVFSRAELINADFRGADLSNAALDGSDLDRANLSGAKLRDASLAGAYLSHSVLVDADLANADLSGAIFTNANATRANFGGSRVYAISAWDVQLDGASQDGLLITPPCDADITVDDIEIAQFVYLLLHNHKIRKTIDLIASKVVLILGAFATERKQVLDSIRTELRRRNYVPIIFDFEKPSSKDLSETVATLAHMARFIIADLSSPSCIPHELASVIPTTVVPVQPILLMGSHEYAMFGDLRRRYEWVLPTWEYRDQAHLMQNLIEHIVSPAEVCAQNLALKK